MRFSLVVRFRLTNLEDTLCGICESKTPLDLQRHFQRSRRRGLWRDPGAQIVWAYHILPTLGEGIRYAESLPTHPL